MSTQGDDRGLGGPSQEDFGADIGGFQQIQEGQGQEGQQRPRGTANTRIFHANAIRDQFLDEIRERDDARSTELREL